MAETTELLHDVEAVFPSPNETNDSDLAAASFAVEDIMARMSVDGTLPELVTANALRAILNSGGPDDLVKRAGAILGPSENYGGRASFRYILPFTGALILIFGLLFVQDRRTGGYRATRIEEGV